jgi:hypothetical protein
MGMLGKLYRLCARAVSGQKNTGITNHSLEKTGLIKLDHRGVTHIMFMFIEQFLFACPKSGELHPYPALSNYKYKLCG